jgi:mono/diheme cytochrome c family protein
MNARVNSQVSKLVKSSAAGMLTMLLLSAVVLGAALTLCLAAEGETSGAVVTPAERVASTPKGELKNPYTDIAAVAEAGHKKYFSAGCNGCHGGNGGGGICPPLTNDTWVYGRDDDTLFRLVALGTDELRKQGYDRKQHEVVTGPMPPFGTIVKSDDDLWKIIAFIRSVNPNSLRPQTPLTPPPG